MLIELQVKLVSTKSNGIEKLLQDISKFEIIKL